MITYVFFGLIFTLGISIATAVLANRKGRNSFSWFLLSIFWGLVGLIILACSKNLDEEESDTIAKVLWFIVFSPILLIGIIYYIISSEKEKTNSQVDYSIEQPSVDKEEVTNSYQIKENNKHKRKNSDEDEIKSQDELIKNSATNSIADVKGKDEVNGKDIVGIREISAETKPVEKEQVYTYVEQPPSFPGGESELANYLRANIKYPQSAKETGIQGRVYLELIVTRNGEITDVKVLRGLQYECDKEAIRVVKSMPRWNPGKQNGHTVTVKFTLPVVFQLR